jgi:hypothetical protein
MLNYFTEEKEENMTRYRISIEDLEKLLENLLEEKVAMEHIKEIITRYFLRNEAGHNNVVYYRDILSTFQQKITIKVKD